MCVILTLEPNQTIDDKMLENAVGNNMDGYGIILQDLSTKHIEVRRGLTENGTDPEEVARILEDNKALTRHVHLRNTTKGATTLENTHPFPVFSTTERQVFFMHNGTVYKFSPAHGDDRSDTKLMAETFVSPLLNRFSGEFGLADYNDPLFKRIIEEFGNTSGNRYLLVSNDLEPLRLGNWPKVKSATGDEFYASNNDYFKTITRGPRRPLAVVSTPQHHGTSTPFRSGPTNSAGAVGTNSTSSQVTLSQGTGPVRGPMGQTHQPQDIKKAQEKRPVTPLSSLRRNAKEFVPSKSLIDALGVSAKSFEDYGLLSLTWMKDEEIGSMLKHVPVDELITLFRQACSANDILSQNYDLAEQVLQSYGYGEDEDTDGAMAYAAETIMKLEKEIETLEQTVEFYEDLEETSQTLLKEIRGLKTRNAYLENCLKGKGIEVQPYNPLKEVA